jgi:hypothetical protein
MQANLCSSTVDQFNYLLEKESWQEGPSNSGVNTSFNAFMVMMLIIIIQHFH